MTFKNVKVLGILLLLLAVFTAGGKKVSAAAEDGALRWKRGISAENRTIYLLSQLLHPGYGQ